MKKITEWKSWSMESVRKACIENNLYTAGDCDEYDHMLSWVRRLYPNTENIMFIAENILKHSEEQTLTNIMTILANTAVTTFYLGDDD